MYNILNKLQIINRVLDEDNDYLLKEEYDLLISIKEKNSHINKILNIYNLYAKKEFENFFGSNAKIILSSIHIVKPNSYNINNYNDITFYVDTAESSISSVYHRRGYKHKEAGFKLSFIKEVNEILEELVKKNCAYRDTTIYKYHAYHFTNEFKQQIKDFQEINELIEKLIDYYKDKVITVTVDERLIKELNEIDDFLKNL